MTKKLQHLKLSSAIAELGNVFRYDNLILWASLNNITRSEIDEELSFLIKNGFAKPFIDVRCPYCGAHLGNFPHPKDIPDMIMCMDCGHKLTKELLLQNGEVAFKLTEKGIDFFRSSIEKYRSENHKRTIEKFVSTLFR